MSELRTRMIRDMTVRGFSPRTHEAYIQQVVWPWRHDDSDPVRDEWLNEFYRLGVWGGSLVEIELGRVLADFIAVPWVVRVLAYALFGAVLLWKRPALRSREFWEPVPYRGRMPRKNGNATNHGC